MRCRLDCDHLGQPPRVFVEKSDDQLFNRTKIASRTFGVLSPDQRARCPQKRHDQADAGDCGEGERRQECDHNPHCHRHCWSHPRGKRAARKEQPQRGDHQPGSDDRIEKILRDDGGECGGRRDATVPEEPTFRRLRQKRSGERQHLHRLAREADAQYVCKANGTIEQAAPQGDGADTDVHGVDRRGGREAPPDAREHARNQSRASAPDQ